MDIYRDFEEFIELLNENKVKYLVVGGYALAFHSRPKYTKDIDFWVNNTKSNAVKLLKTIKEFGFESLNITVEDIVNPDNIIQLGYPPVRIDIISEVEGIKFTKAYKSKVIGTYGGVKNIPFLSFEDLIINKSKVKRIHDIADIDWLKKYKTKKM